MGYREQIFREEEASFPGKTYTETVLEPAYNEAKVHLLAAMMAINKAQLIMLTEQQFISPSEAKQIAKGLQKLDLDALSQSKYTGEYEDLFFQVESLLLKEAGDIAGNLHLARSRNDMGIAMYRLALREKLYSTISSALFLKRKLISFAEEHVGTVMIAYTHTQQAQPTTLAHYIMAVVDGLSRDIRRMMESYRNCNRSSMGAAALTTSGFAIKRERMADLLAFDEIIENSYDAIGGADYVGEIAVAVQLAAIHLGRVAQDFLLWSTQEFSALKLANPYVQISSIMPQKRNPVSLEHMRSLLSSCIGNSNTILMMMHNTPFGDIVDTEDDLQPYAWKSLKTLENMYRLFACVVTTMEVNKEVLRQRAEESFATVTELADTLVRTNQLSFRQAHHVVSKVVQRAMADGMTVKGITPSFVNQVSIEILGRPLTLGAETLKKALDPLHFVTIRALPGGPAPQEMKRMIEKRRQQESTYQKWLDHQREKWENALAYLDQVISEWSKT